MPLFTYKAIDTRGKSVLGRVEAVNLFDLEGLRASARAFSAVGWRARI
jgi:hypothetical protein